LETLDNGGVARRVEGTRRVPADAAQLIQKVPLVTEGRIHPSLFFVQR
jgi:hypothetical protein